MINKHLFSIFILVLFMAYTGATNAQTDFVQSRFLGEPDATVCSRCDPADGIVHVRFKPGATRLIDDGGVNHVEFTPQLRKAGGIDLGIVQATFRLSFDTAVFNRSLNTPPIATGNNVNTAGQCSFVRAETFTMGTRNYSIFFGDSFPNELGITEQSGFVVLPAVNIARPESFVFFTEEWQDMVTMRCMIPSGMESSEADFAVSGSEPEGFAGGQFPESGDRDDGAMFLLADNDLRGFRLDGKTWAEDYSRYGDGKGVRVKFSKRIRTQLNTDSFTLELMGERMSTPTIESVTHTAESRYATILFTGAVNAGEVRLTTATTVAMDVDDGALADDSFVAALHYDGDAPSVTGFDKVGGTVGGMSTWNMDFSAPINEATLKADNFCITESEDDDVCPEETSPVEPPVEPPLIVSVSPAVPGSTTNTRAVVVINEGDGKRGRTLSIEPKRNAVLGIDSKIVNGVFSIDLKVVEDYQKVLRGALEIEDTQDPVITLTAERPVEGTAANQYIIVFTVTADEPVPTIATTASYQLIHINRDDGAITAQSGSPVITAITGGARLTYTLTLADISNTQGFTLVRATANALRDTGDRDPVRVDGTTTIGSGVNAAGQIDPDVISSFSSLACSAFYPHIGQTELFFEIDGLAVNTAGLEINGDPIDAENVEQIGQTVDTVSVFKVTLAEEITVAEITANYQPTVGGPANEILDTSCEDSVALDSDEDGVIDIVDNNPFADGDDAINTNLTSSEMLGDAPAMDATTYYSRSVIIRALLRSEEFAYLDSENEEQTFSANDAIDATAYFGIESGSRAFRYPDAGDCETVIDAAIATNLNQVNIEELCTEVTNSFGDEPTGMQRYVWVRVGADSRLESKGTVLSGVQVVPEVNFVGQSSYLLIDPTEGSLDIASYIGAGSSIAAPPNIAVSSTTTQITFEALSAGLYEASYEINHSRAGRISHWLVGGSNAANVLSLTDTTIQVADGGHGHSAIEYVIGPNNKIDTLLVTEEEQVVTELSQILLYEYDDETNNTTLTSFMVEGRSYVLGADYRTNKSDIEEESDIIPILEDPDKYNYLMMEPPAILSSFDARVFLTVNNGIVGDSGVDSITLGWDKLVSLENIEVTYPVVAGSVVNTGGALNNIYNTADADRDRIPEPLDMNDADGTQLSAGTNNILETANDDQELFMSYTGIAIAISKAIANMDAVTEADWIAANIGYMGLGEIATSLLGFNGEEMIESIATFGIRNVDYGIGDNDSVTGGVTYTVFPYISSSVGETLYLSKYNNERRMWERFVRGTLPGYADTWYAIHTDEPCPTDVELYKNQHQGQGDRSGFTANAQNCIMLVITDGGPYDSDGIVNGNVVDPTGIGTELFESPTIPGEGRRGGGGGGGAIGVSDMLILLGALVLLIVSTRQRKQITAKS